MPEPETNSIHHGPRADCAERSAGPDEPDPDAAPHRPESEAIQIEMGFEVACDDDLLRDWLAEQAVAAARAAGVCRGELSIAVVGDDQMAELHEQYKNVPGTTDVLTFDLGEGLRDDAVEGEIIICLDEARRQSASRGHELRHELLLYVVHGILHLLGEDDVDPASFERMHRREDAILTDLGLGPIFAGGDAAS